MRIFVPSLSRAGNVPAMERQAGGAELVWCVPPEEASLYRRFGARRVIVGPPRKADKMNAVLDRFGDDWCVFSDDDLRRMRRLVKGKLQPCSLNEAAQLFVATGRAMGTRLVNIGAVTNTRYAHEGVSSWGQTPGWFFAVAPDTPERFDTTLLAIEDSDFAARIFDHYGRISRMNSVIGEYRFGGKDSRVNHQRDNEHAFQTLCRRWPHLFSGYTDEMLIVNPLPRKVERKLARVNAGGTGSRGGGAGSA